MKIIHGEHNIMVDVDNTIALWDPKHKKPGKGKLKFVDPYTKNVLYLTPHNVHIRIIRQWKARGFKIFVWSMSGVMWAEEVVRVLGLEDAVDYVMSKPEKHVDDAEKAQDIIGSRVYLKPDTV